MLTFFHAPQSRSSSILWLLEELGVPYRMELVDLRRPGGAPESYREIHPHKKVPAVVHEGVTITERAAISAYLADAFPDAGLAPAPGDPRRGPYLSWLVYADAVVDPNIAAKTQGWSYPAASFSFGAFDDMLRHVEQALARGPYVLGDRFTAVDTQLASTLGWAMHMTDLIPKTPAFVDYLARVHERPAYRRAAQKDAG